MGQVLVDIKKSCNFVFVRELVDVARSSRG